MTLRSDRRPNLVVIVLLFEGGLGLLALILGLILGPWPLVGVRLGWEALPEQAVAVGWGAVAALPMLAGLGVIECLPLKSLERLRQFVQQRVVPLFSGATVGQLAAISLAAGVGEEMLFRGWLQTGLSGWMGPPYGPWIGLAVASVLFGVCHWLTPAYAVLATLIGLYLGGLLLWTENLLTPLTAHALYDFLALLYLVYGHPGPAGGEELAE